MVESSSEYRRVPRDGLGQLAAEIRKIKEQLRALAGGAPLRAAGIFLTKAGMRIASSLSVEGDLTATGSTTIGGTLDVSGDLATTGTTTLGGDVAIVGTLSLPAGIIDNDALVSPITFDAVGNSTGGFEVPAAWTDLVSVGMTVPPGYARSQYTAFATVETANSTANTQYLYARIVYTLSSDPGSTFNSVRSQVTLPAGFWGVCVVPLIYSVDRPAGTVFTFTVQGWASSAFGPTANAHARIQVAGTFTR